MDHSLPLMTARLIERHCPVAVYSKNEPFPPADPSKFLSACSLTLHEEKGAKGKKAGKETVIPLGEVYAESLAACAATHPHADLRLEVDLDALKPTDDVDDVPIFAVAKRIEHEGLTEINYIIFHAQDGGKGCLRTNKHKADWEHITARCRSDDGTLQAVFFSCHGHREGCWVPANKVPRLDGRILTHIAHRSHGHYAKSGIFPRIFCCANDSTTGLGKKNSRLWRPRRCVMLERDVMVTPSKGGDFPEATQAILEDHSTVIPAPVTVDMTRPEWADFRGRWGRINSPRTQFWYREAEQTETASLTSRLCLPCMRL